MAKDFWHNPCPNCGKPKYHTAALCLECRTKQEQQKPSKHQKDLCECGRPKLVTSQKCRRCYSGKDIELAEYRGRNKPDLPPPSWEKASRDWLVQFVGIFLSEGCVHTRLSPGHTLSLSLTIKLRADDLPCLEAIQEALGGSVKVYQPEQQAPEAVWTVTKMQDIRAILEAIRSLVVIPMKKAAEFEIALEYLDWRESVGFHHVDREKVAEFHERLKVAKQLKG